MLGYIRHVDLKGFKSIRELSLDLRPLNVLIGANGSGKSNFVSFFQLLRSFTREEAAFRVQKTGGANSMLFDGASTTATISARLDFRSDLLRSYRFELEHAARDMLLFRKEAVLPSAITASEEWVDFSSRHFESRLPSAADRGDWNAVAAVQQLRHCSVYQFHDMSETAKIRARWVEDDSYRLREDGGNLGAFLLRLSIDEPAYYRRILSTIRIAAPYVVEFQLEPQGGMVMLQWRERHSDLLFGPHQASDGSLRWFALAALLLQPESRLPGTLILDEPELGLHPSAINLIGGMIKSTAQHCQVIVCTQSAALIDHFEADDIVVVDRPERESRFRRLQPGDLSEWLDEYSLGQLWEKNVIGGRP